MTNGVSQIVIDANVLNHSSNPDSSYFPSALEVVTGLLDSDVNLALDDTGKASPDEWTSNLYREYRECLPPLSLAANVVTALLNAGRVTFHLRPERAVWATCKAIAPKNKNDAIVLGIGVATPNKRVVSNDFADFPKSVRKQAKKQLDVRVVDSDEYVA